MISIKIEPYKSVSIKGHTVPDVCAAVSSIILTCVNLLEATCTHDQYRFKDDGKELQVMILQSSSITDNIMKVLTEEFITLSEDYPMNVETKISTPE